MKYKIIYADPPWKFNNKNTGGSMKSGADSHYPTMTLEEMKHLPINEITDDNAVLFMWWVGAMPKEAIELTEAWGFTFKTMTAFQWNKITKNNKPHFGMGFYTRQGSENVLLGIKGKFKPASHSIRSVFEADEQIQFEAPVFKHSQKPHQVRDLIVELCGDLPRIELFSRDNPNGWDVFGNQCDNSINLY